jgi:hypothetical protein
MRLGDNMTRIIKSNGYNETIGGETYTGALNVFNTVDTFIGLDKNLAFSLFYIGTFTITIVANNVPIVTYLHEDSWSQYEYNGSTDDIISRVDFNGKFGFFNLTFGEDYFVILF